MKGETQIYPAVGSSDDDYGKGRKKCVGECTQKYITVPIIKKFRDYLGK